MGACRKLGYPLRYINSDPSLLSIIYSYSPVLPCDTIFLQLLLQCGNVKSVSLLSHQANLLDTNVSIAYVFHYLKDISICRQTLFCLFQIILQMLQKFYIIRVHEIQTECRSIVLHLFVLHDSPSKTIGTDNGSIIIYQYC